MKYGSTINKPNVIIHRVVSCVQAWHSIFNCWRSIDSDKGNIVAVVATAVKAAFTSAFASASATTTLLKSIALLTQSEKKVGVSQAK
jgi:hypothetical protein